MLAPILLSFAAQFFAAGTPPAIPVAPTPAVTTGGGKCSGALSLGSLAPEIASDANSPKYAIARRWSVQAGDGNPNHNMLFVGYLYQTSANQVFVLGVPLKKPSGEISTPAGKLFVAMDSNSAPDKVDAQILGLIQRPETEKGLSYMELDPSTLNGLNLTQCE